MRQSSTEPLIGAHMSIAGGYYKAILRGQEIGCTAIAIFTTSNRQWRAKPIADEEADLFKATYRASTIKSIIAHAGYLINIGAGEKATHTRSKESLQEELARCEQLGVPALVLHPGAATGHTLDESLELISATCDEVLTAVPGKTMILLETMAGQGTVAGSTLDQLATIRDEIKQKERIGFCVDTCHVFAAGYDISTPEGYKHFFKEFDSILGLQHLKAFHVNDSLKPAGSHVDRHAFIGKGLMGLEPFRLLMNDPRFVHIPKILETPVDTYQEYAKDLAVLKSLMAE